VLLAKFMNACAKRAVGTELIPRAKTDPSHTDSLATIEENIVNLTSHFAPLLPKLLDKFSMETDVVAELVQIAQCFSLDVYAAYGFEQVRLSVLFNSSSSSCCCCCCCCCFWCCYWNIFLLSSISKHWSRNWANFS
jgi:hypothetical protein